MKIEKATKEQARLRMAFQGPSGAGKSTWAIKIGQLLTEKRIGIIDTERAAGKYANLYGSFDLIHVNDDFNPERFIQALQMFESTGEHDVVIIDSLTHCWTGLNGFLGQVDLEVKKAVARGNKADSFSAWKSVDRQYGQFIQRLLGSPMHLLMTVRSKSEYVRENNKLVKAGLSPQFREGYELELDVQSAIDCDGHLAILKTRCSELSGQVFSPKQDEEKLARILKEWVTDGVAAAPVENSLSARITACTTREELNALVAEIKSSDNQSYKDAWIKRNKEVS